ncbi:hypothetical protein FOG18_05585 [Legionella israelensis]|uniref:hypothetical protein n=1 Tax=Legionella israelensis TaxID=454 RepID=UPI00117DCFE3|nr:hypothetical protein [Legionella israelensis]QDP72078.1 hypothetical protein FOG18_05585 [Legionella israelensis]
MDTAVDAAVIRAILFSQSIDLQRLDKYNGVLLWSLIYCIPLPEKWLKSRLIKDRNQKQNSY